MKLAVEAVSDVGRKRKGNEDSLFVNPEQNLFVVADGMGGHAAGEVASQIAVDSINEFVCLTGGDEEITWPFGLDENISYDGNRLKTADPLRQPQGPGGHPGAERVRGHGHHRGRRPRRRGQRQPRSRGRQPDLPPPRRRAITQLTNDHSWVNEQLQSGDHLRRTGPQPPPTQRGDPRRWEASADLQVDMQAHKMQAGDILLLCSDGLTTMLPDEEIGNWSRPPRRHARRPPERPGGRRQRPRRRGQHHRPADQVRGLRRSGIPGRLNPRRPTPAPPASASASTPSPAASARAAWAWSTAATTRSSSGRSRVKTLTVEGTLDEESRQRFEIEAKAAARLQHPNIVTVFELGEDTRRSLHRHGAARRASTWSPLLRSGEPLLLAGEARHHDPGLPRAWPSPTSTA